MSDMEGFIFINSDGERLTREKWWDRIRVWVFTREERDEIMRESRTWAIKPAYIQRARVNETYTEVETLGDEIPVI